MGSRPYSRPVSAGEVTAVAVVLFGFALVSRRIERWPLTMPMVFVGLGWLTDETDLIEIPTDGEVIALVAEVTLAVILFSDAVRIDPARLRRHLALPARLLLIGLPLTIAFGTLVNVGLFADLAVAQAALLAAILAPTDAALGSAVVEDDVVPARDRLTLNVESGVNDGLVVPVVAVLTAVVVDESRSAGSWAGFVAEQIGFGVLVGVVIGAGAITVLGTVHRRGWSDGRYEQLATFVVPIVALFGASAIDGNSFIAAFVAGLCFGALAKDPTRTHREGRAAFFAGFTEDAAQLLAVVAFFLFGNVLVGPAVGDIDATIVVAAIASLTVVRMLPVWLSLVGTGLPTPTRAFLGWFGPRGLASIVFGLLLLDDIEEIEGAGEELFGVIAVTVVASVVLHGATAAVGARRYGEFAARQPGPEEEHEMSDDEMPAMRWARR